VTNTQPLLTKHLQAALTNRRQDTCVRSGVKNGRFCWV